MLPRGVLLLVSLLMCASGVARAQSPAPPVAGPTFKSGIDLVTVSAVVRDKKGRVVTDLRRTDFELFDGGRPRPIAEFRPDEAPVSVAILFDASGSMQVASKIDEARAAAKHLLSWLVPNRDEVGIYSFDSGLRELQAFSTQEKSAEVDRSIS